MIKTEFRLIGLFYPPNKGSSDFILRTNFDNLVPIEVGLGNKKETQIKKDMEKYKCKYGILVSNKFNKIEINNNIIHIPLIYSDLYNLVHILIYSHIFSYKYILHKIYF
jgi:predicted AAA+ superfamily ATPase